MQERGCREWTRRQITKVSSTVRACGLHSGPHRITFQPRASSVRRRTVIFMTPCGLKPKGADTGTRSLSSFLMILFSIRPSAPRRAAATTVARTSRRRHRDEPSPCPCDRPIVCPQQQTARVGPSVFIFARVRLGDLATLVVPRPLGQGPRWPSLCSLPPRHFLHSGRSSTRAETRNSIYTSRTWRSHHLERAEQMSDEDCARRGHCGRADAAVVRIQYRLSDDTNMYELHQSRNEWDASV